MKAGLLAVLWPLILGPLAVHGQYFQQEVRYRIDVSLDDRSHALDGHLDLVYINHSPDTLPELYFHLWPNAYRDSHTALAKQLLRRGDASLYFAPDSLRGSISKLAFRVNGAPVAFRPDSQYADICMLPLDHPLAPGDSLNVTTPFYVKLPAARFSRLGHEGQSYFISQWYPKPAVYDREGWHPMPYLDLGEFYSEFGSYEVHITLPRNYVLGATGNRMTEADVRFMNEKAAGPETGWPGPVPPSHAELKTVTFRESRIHDFAWFADKRFRVMKGQASLPSGKKVTTWVLHKGSRLPVWKGAVGYLNRALESYSEWVGEYPYDQCTVVQGTISAGRGMEYPGITIIGDPSSAFLLEDVIVHEVGHNWFYGILGTNERAHPWLDEGVNSFYELRYMEKAIRKGRLPGNQDAFGLGRLGRWVQSPGFGFRDSWAVATLLTRRTRRDLPATLPAEAYPPLNYGVEVYFKTGLLFNYLMAYLGEDLFDECMRSYFREWRFRHPGPGDLEEAFEKVSGKNLDWFFTGLLSTSGRMDYSLSSVRRAATGEGFEVTLKNRGNQVYPVPYAAMKGDSVVQSGWIDGFTGSSTLRVGHADRVHLDPDRLIPEMNRRNNRARTRGVLKTWQAPEFRLLGGLRDDKPGIYALPVIGWNNYNKTMAGVALYNKFVPHKDFEYVFVPMFASRTGNMAGSGSVSWTWYPGGTPWHHVTFTAGLKHYAYDYGKVLQKDQDAVFWYYTAQPVTARLDFRKSDVHSPVSTFLECGQVHTWQDASVYDGVTVRKKNEFRAFRVLRLTHQNERTLDPYRLGVSVEHGERYLKAGAGAAYTFSYRGGRRGVSFRGGMSAFLWHDTNNPVYNLRLSSDPGYYDYLYTENFIGRNERDGIWSQQMMHGGGGFKVASAVGSSDEWIAYLNVDVDFPGKLPFALFADLGSYSGAWDPVFERQKIVFDAGITVKLIRDIAEVYLPLVKASDISDALRANDRSFAEQIRFVLHLDGLNPFLLRDKALK